jgi:hypothetical protein
MCKPLRRARPWHPRLPHPLKARGSPLVGNVRRAPGIADVTELSYITTWPEVDGRGRLRFAGSRPVSVDVDQAALATYLATARLPERLRNATAPRGRRLRGPDDDRTTRARAKAADPRLAEVAGVRRHRRRPRRRQGRLPDGRRPPPRGRVNGCRFPTPSPSIASPRRLRRPVRRRPARPLPGGRRRRRHPASALARAGGREADARRRRRDDPQAAGAHRIASGRPGARAARRRHRARGRPRTTTISGGCPSSSTCTTARSPSSGTAASSTRRRPTST